MLKEGDIAPLFSAPNQDGVTFDLASRRGQGFTVLYFYPKAGTPGCTKQACAFRDSIKGIKDLGGEVFGLSGDTVVDLKKFQTSHHLPFMLLADPDAKIIESYGVKTPLLKMAKRWTFVLDGDLKIRWVERDVDPMLDASRVMEKIKEIKGVKAAG